MLEYLKLRFNKYKNNIICFFKGHDFGATRATHYKEQNDLILYDELKSCKRCHKTVSEAKYSKRLK